MTKDWKEEVIATMLKRNGAASRYVTTQCPSLTPKEAAQRVDAGKELTHKGADIHSVGGKHIRTNPDDKKSNNLVPKK